MSDNKLFRAILRRSWDMLVKRPALWIFAFLATGVAGIGIVDAFLGAWKVMTKALAPSLEYTSTHGSVIWTWLTPPYTYIYLPIFAIVFVAIGLFFFAISVISLGALIRGVIDKKQHTLKSAWKVGLKHAWQLAGVVIGRRVAVFVVLFLTALFGSWLYGFNSVWAQFGLVVLALASLLGILIVSLLAVYAETSIVIENTHVLDALKKSWDVFRNHVVLSLEMAVVLFLVELVIIALAAALGVLIAMPVFMLWIVSGITGFAGFFIFGAIVGIILLGIIIFLFPAWTIMISVSSWAYLYMQTRKGNVKSRILHFFGH